MHIDEKLDKVTIVLLISDVWRSFEIVEKTYNREIN